MDATVADIMRKKFTSFKKSDPITKALDVFITNPDMVFPVIDDTGRVIGEVAQHELLKLAIPPKYDKEHVLGPSGVRELIEHSGKTVGDFMKEQRVAIHSTASVVDAARLMTETRILTVEVIDSQGKPIGFVSELDILKYLKKKLSGGSK
jgi:CBS domain-containing protein